MKKTLMGCLLGLLLAISLFYVYSAGVLAQNSPADTTAENAQRMVVEGRHTFRFDTFGDEAYWGDKLKLHEAVALLSPKHVLALGLKVDAEAVPADVVNQLKQGKVNLDDPAVTLALLKAKAVPGVTGFFNSSGSLSSIGFQCAVCHSRVDDSFSAPGIPPGNIGHRLDGWANRDLNIGALIASAPNLTPIASTLGVDVAMVKKVLLAWGPGKFDAELLLDGKGFRPDGKTAATLIPPAFGLAGVNLHTWTGAWGTVTYWNAFVANIEMHGKGRFFDPRLKDAAQFPIAAKNGFADIKVDPDDDHVTPKLAALHFYQLALRSPKPPEGSFDKEAFKRGDQLFSGKAKCNSCHVEPVWSEPGWNLHTASEICIDDFQANRAPDKRYRTAPLGGLFTHQKGGFYHDGRFANLGEVVNHYNSCLVLGLSDGEKSDLVQYLLGL